MLNKYFSNFALLASQKDERLRPAAQPVQCNRPMQGAARQVFSSCPTPPNLLLTRAVLWHQICQPLFFSQKQGSRGGGQVPRAAGCCGCCCCYCCCCYFVNGFLRMPHFIYASGQKDARRFVLTQGERTCAGLGSEAIKSTPAFNCQGKLVVPDLCCPV